MGYKRYGSSQSIPNFNDDNNGEAVSNCILKNSSKKEIYFGIKKPKSAADSDKPWRELTTDDFDTQITSETDGCSATITKNNNDPTNKTGIIRYTLSKNTTGSTRLITFNYKGTDLFKINQARSTEPQDTEILVYILTYKPTALNILSVFSEDNPNMQYNIQFTEYGQCKMAFTLEEKDKYVCVYYSAKNISHNNKTLNQLIQDGVLTYKSGIQIHSNFGNSIIKQWPTYVKNNNISKINVINEKTKMYVYTETSNNIYVRESDNIMCFENGGIYKYKEPNKIYIVSFTTDEEKNLCFFSSETINNSFIAASNFYSQIISNPVKINNKYVYLYYYSDYDNIDITSQNLGFYRNKLNCIKQGKIDLSTLDDTCIFTKFDGYVNNLGSYKNKIKNIIEEIRIYTVTNIDNMEKSQFTYMTSINFGASTHSTNVGLYEYII